MKLKNIETIEFQRVEDLRTSQVFKDCFGYKGRFIMIPYSEITFEQASLFNNPILDCDNQSVVVML